MTRVGIDIWSDILCPWCLVGWGALRQALDTLEGEIAAEVRWHAFELNPDMAPEGEERTAHIARKYGRTAAEARGVQDRMREAARTAGVSLDYDGPDPAPPAMMWNTFAAHRLLAGTRETAGAAKQTELKLALFRAHFNERRRIGEDAVLLDIAEETGLDRASAKVALSDERYARTVRAEERAAMEMGVGGVPAMVIADKFMVPGAQPAQAYVDALRRVAKRLPAA